MYVDRKSIYINIYIYFYLGFLTRTLTIHRTAGERGGYLFNSSLPLPLTSQTLRHQLGNYCTEPTSAHSQKPDSNQSPLVSESKSLIVSRWSFAFTGKVLMKSQASQKSLGRLQEEVLTTSYKKVVATYISDQSKTSLRPKIRRSCLILAFCSYKSSLVVIMEYTLLNKEATTLSFQLVWIV